MKQTTKVRVSAVSAENAEQRRDQIARLYASAFRRAPWNEEWTVDEAWESVILKLRLGADLFLAIREEDDQVVGLGLGIVLNESYPDAPDLARFGLGNGSYYCIDMAVDQSAQNSGIGRRLLRARERRARILGVPKIGMRTRPDNESCLHLYRSEGYVERGTYRVETGHVMSTRTVLSKEL